MLINSAFIDKIWDLGLIQTNETPTRDNKAALSPIHSQFTIPGLSDHNIVFIDSNIRPNKVEPTPMVSSWKKSNIDTMKSEWKNSAYI